MNLESHLLERSGSRCELCEADVHLEIYSLNEDDSPENKALICETCKTGVEGANPVDVGHWRCLSNSMWSEQEAIKILSFFMLKNLKNEGWALELLEQFYMEDELREKAERFLTENSSEPEREFALDSNGAKLFEGDAVTLVKDLEVKGANFTAKRGTLVKNISLTGEVENIEGKINGTQIVLKTKFLKKVN